MVRAYAYTHSQLSCDLHKRKEAKENCGGDYVS
jgi:hypothetical protein